MDFTPQQPLEDDDMDDAMADEIIEHEADALAALANLEAFTAAVPEGSYITLRHEANPPMYVTFYEGEETITLRTAIERRGLVAASSVNAYLDGNQVDFNVSLAPGSLVTLVGNVKGGRTA